MSRRSRCGRFLAPVAALALIGSFATAASAQDPLEHGFVEPCTMSNVEERHLVCEVCPSAFGSRACQDRLEPRGYAKKCRTRGGHDGWQEIWCAARPPPEKERDQTLWLVVGAAGTLVAAGALIRFLRGPQK